GVAIGFTGGAGIAGLAAAVGYFTMVNILKIVSDTEKLNIAINTGVFGGILIGLLAAQICNRFQNVKLPQVLGFFSGKRFVPILMTATSFALALLLGFIWPPIQKAIYEFGNSVISSDYGPAFYAAGKRLLIPVGLHHVYYPPFLYEFGQFITSTGQVIKGESARYFAGDPAAGRIMASEFPLMLFGLPAAALAMFLASPKEKRKAVGGVMLSAALTSMLTGITEPIEFAFIFVAPLLYVLHVAFAFIAGLLTAHFDVHLGYTFSASFIDYALGYFNQKNSSYLFLFIGPFISALYFLSFYTLIRFFNFQTPGRELEKPHQDEASVRTPQGSGGKAALASEVLLALGGKHNIESLDACITRLRVVVKDAAKVQSEQLKKLGAAGVMQSGRNIQAIFGVESDFLKEAIKASMTKSSLFSPAKGRVLPLREVPDNAFAENILGEGFAVEPQEGMIYAPCSGQIVNIFPTKHALGILSEDGLEVLVHVGIDTVQMKGEGFQSFVAEGQHVNVGDRLIGFDLELVRQKAKSLITPIVITNMDTVEALKLVQEGSVTAGQKTLEVLFKA
ncbi:MAG: glucose PTS transporter subunit IIA, partial [Pseudobdellovibrionaceae bacterium]